MLIIFLISFDSGQNKIGGHLKKVDRINIWLFHSGFQEGYQTLKMLTIIQSWLFALDVCRNVMTLYWYHSLSRWGRVIARCLLYHSGWLRFVHFDNTTMIMQRGDVSSAVHWCAITLQSCFITVGICAFIISILLSLSMLLGWRLLRIFFFTLGLRGVLVRVSIIPGRTDYCCLVCVRRSRYEWWVEGLLQRVDPFVSPMYRLCSIRMQGFLHGPQYLVFLGNEMKPRFPHKIRHNSESNVT